MAHLNKVIKTSGTLVAFAKADMTENEIFSFIVCSLFHYRQGSVGRDKIHSHCGAGKEGKQTR